MAEKSKARILVVLGRHCKQIIPVFNLPPCVSLETAGEPNTTKFNIVSSLPFPREEKKNPGYQHRQAPR
jgi:hypothetical protein